jgi:hypothetical protein
MRLRHGSRVRISVERLSRIRISVTGRQASRCLKYPSPVSTALLTFSLVLMCFQHTGAADTTAC